MAILRGLGVATLLCVGLAAPVHAAASTAATPARPNAFTCFTVGPIYVNGQPVYPGQYVVCVPSPASP